MTGLEPYEPPQIASRGWRVGPAQYPVNMAGGTGAALDVEVSLAATAAMDLATADGAGVPAELLYTQLANFDMLPAAGVGDGLSADNGLSVPVAADLADGSGADALVPTLSITYPYVWSDDFNRANNTSTLGASWTNRNNTMGILSNAAYAVGGFNTICVASNTTTMPADNQQVDVILSGAVNVILMLGADSTGVGAMLNIVNGGTANIFTTTGWNVFSGSTSRLTITNPITMAAGGKLTFKRVGNVYSALYNDAAITGVTWTDSGTALTRSSSYRLTAIGGTTGFSATAFYDSAQALTP